MEDLMEAKALITKEITGFILEFGMFDIFVT